MEKYTRQTVTINFIAVVLNEVVVNKKTIDKYALVQTVELS